MEKVTHGTSTHLSASQPITSIPDFSERTNRSADVTLEGQGYRPKGNAPSTRGIRGFHF